MGLAPGGRTSQARPYSQVRSAALFNREVYGYTSRLSPRREAQRYSFMVLQAPTDTRWVRILHRWHPGLKILLYQHILQAHPGGLQDCITFSQARAHSDWFLTNSAGRITTPGAGYAMDIGNPGYQQACTATGVLIAKRHGFDGVYFDGVDASALYQFHGGHPSIPRYRSDASWQAAMYSLLRYAGATAHAHGLLLIGNIGGARTPLWRWWNGPLDGAEEEFWTDGKYGLAQWLWWWPQQLAQVAWSEAHGKYVILHSPNTSTAGNLYGLASMLLVANGHTSYSTANGNYSGYERWYPFYSAAKRLGAPLGGYWRRRAGVYERAFAHGIVLVNATTHGAGRLSLHGRYSGSGRRHVRSVSMGPTSALILRVG